MKRLGKIFQGRMMLILQINIIYSIVSIQMKLFIKEQSQSLSNMDHTSTGSMMCLLMWYMTKIFQLLGLVTHSTVNMSMGLLLQKDLLLHIINILNILVIGKIKWTTQNKELIHHLKLLIKLHLECGMGRWLLKNGDL